MIFHWSLKYFHFYFFFLSSSFYINSIVFSIGSLVFSSAVFNLLISYNILFISDIILLSLTAPFGLVNVFNVSPNHVYSFLYIFLDSIYEICLLIPSSSPFLRYFYLLLLFLFLTTSHVFLPLCMFIIFYWIPDIGIFHYWLQVFVAFL